MIKRLLFPCLLVFILISCTNSKLEEERQKQKSVLDRWEKLSSELDKETGIDSSSSSEETKARNTLNMALSYYDEAMAIVNYTNSIQEDYKEMNAKEIMILTELRNIAVYFNCIQTSQRRFDEGQYEACIESANTAIHRFNDSKDAYMKAGILNKYRL